MAVSEFVGRIYGKIEDSFYGLLDFLDQKGIPVYSVVDPLEERGVPALPLAVFLVLLVAFLFYAFFFAGFGTAKVALEITNSDGSQPLNGVELVAVDELGKTVELDGTLFNNGQKIFLKGVPIGRQVTFTGSKEGFFPDDFELTLKGANDVVRLLLQKEVTIINGRIKLTDPTGDNVDGARVVAKFSNDSTIVCPSLGNGVYECNSILEGEEVRMTVTSGNYEEFSDLVTFLDGSEHEIPLVPKASAQEGQTNLIIRVIDSQSKKPVAGPNIKIYDSSDDGLITDWTDDDGEFLAKINKGTSVRLVVSAKDFVRYDSSLEGDARTLRADEETWVVELRPGGVTVTARVRDEDGVPQTGVLLELFNEAREVIDSKTTGLAGEIDFDDLNAQATFFVTAFKAGFLPLRQNFVPLDSSELNLKLLRATTSNSARLQVLVANPDGTAANDVSLGFFEVSGDDVLPLGIPVQKTDVSGKFSANVALGKEVLVKAVKGSFAGEEKITVRQNAQTDLFIKLQRIGGLVKLVLVNPAGELIRAGHVRVETAEGDMLLDEDLESVDANDLYFYPNDSDYVNVKYLSSQNENFSSQVFVKGKEEVVVTISGTALLEGFSPEVKFLGVTDIFGKDVEGVNKGQDYFLLFEATFAQGDAKHGLHVRVGDDTVKYADSQDVGIVGYSGIGSSVFYSRTFSAFPEPGMEGVDFSNEGKPGNYNKWVEVYFDEGGTKLVKVRVQAKETSTDTSFDVHFRAWSEFGPAFYRAPTDTVLGTDSFSSQKSGLYAQTETKTVKIFETTSTCRTDFCVSYSFVSNNDVRSSAKDFTPVIEGLYALELTVSPSVEIDAAIKASTSKTDPKVFFQGYSVDTFSVLPDNNKTDTSIELNGLLSPAGKDVKVYLFFKAVDLGMTSITVQTINDKTVVTDNFFFEVFEEKQLFVRTDPAEVVFGEDFSFVVEDSDKNPVENASIELSDSLGTHLQTIVGVGVRGKGKDGFYSVKNTFNKGKINFEARAQHFKPATGQVEIVRKNVLSLPQSVEIKIVAGQGEVLQQALLENLSDSPVQNISFEIKRLPGFPPEMSLRADPVFSIDASGRQNISLRAAYTGQASTAFGQATLVARGMLDGQFNVSASTNVTINYNQSLPQDCLEFSKARLLVFLDSGSNRRPLLSDSYNKAFYDQTSQSYNYSKVNSMLGYPELSGSQYDPSRYYNSYDYSQFGLDPSLATYANTFDTPLNRYFGYNSGREVELLVRNKCAVELDLAPQVIAREPNSDDGIRVQVGNVKLKPFGTVQDGIRKDEQRVKVTVSNTIVRNYPSLVTYGFDILFAAPAITKALPLDVLIWDPKFGLDFTRNIELWLSQENPSVPARAQSPIFMRNVGQAPIENINLRQLSGGATRGNVDLRIQPAGAINFLAVGSEVFPQKTIVAEAIRTEKSTPVDMKIISVGGVVNGSLQDFGPIYVSTHVSGIECLSVSPNSLQFVSEKSTGAISKTLTVKNSCSEEIRVRQINPNQFGSNTLGILGPDILLGPGTQTNIDIVFNKTTQWEDHTTVVLEGFLVRSAKFVQSNPITVEIRIGPGALKTNAGFEEKSILVCGTDQTKKVRFPKIATTPDCQNAYCDSELLAEFLVQKASEKLKEVQRQVSSYKSDILNTNCGQAQGGYCDFSNLNVGNETFTVFFQNDNLSPELLKKVADKKATDLSRFRFDYTSGKNVGPQIGQIGNKIFLNGVVSGCGVYNVTIGGAVKVIGQKLEPELVNILIDLFPIEGQESEKDLTDQCVPKIQNAMNFLPQDKSFNAESDTGDTWLGVVKAQDKRLQDLSKEAAKELFSSPDRFVESVGSTNYLSLGFGAPSDYLVKLEINRTDSGGPKEIRALVQEAGFNEATKTTGAQEKALEKIDLQSQPGPAPGTQNPKPPVQPAGTQQGNGQQTIPQAPAQPAQPVPSTTPPAAGTPAKPTATSLVKTQIEREAAKAIAGLKKNAIDGCISPNDDFFLLKSAAEVSGIEIELGSCTDQVSGKDGQITLIPGQNSCCEFTVSSPLQEKIVSNFVATSIPGIKDTRILLGDQSVAQKEVELKEKDAKTNKFRQSLLLCTTAGEDFVQAREKTVSIEAASAKNDQRKATAKQVSLQVCGVHPSKLLEKAQQVKEPGTYYATLVWKGAPESIHFNDIKLAPDAKARLEGAKGINVGQNTSGQFEVENQKSMKQIAGLGIYLGVCGLTSVLSSWKFGFGWFTDLAFNCLIPAASAGADLLDVTKSMKNFVSDAVKDVPILSSVVNFFGEQAKKIAGLFDQNKGTIEESKLNELSATALSSVSTYSTIRAFSGATGQVNLLKNGAVANQLSNQLSKKIMDEEFRKIFLTPGPRTLADISPFKRDILRVALRDAYQKEIKNALNEFRRPGLSYDSIVDGEKSVLQTAVEKAHVQVAKDKTVLKAFADMKDELIKAGTKDALKDATKSAEKATKDFKSVIDEAGHSARTGIPLNNATATTVDIHDLGHQKDILFDKFVHDNLEGYKSQLKEIYGEKFLEQDIGGGYKVDDIMETELKSHVKSEIDHLSPIKKIIDVPGTPGTIFTPGTAPTQRIEFSLDFPESEAKHIMKSGIEHVNANPTIKPLIKDFVNQKSIGNIFEKSIGTTADDIITQEGGAFKLKWSKFKSLLQSPFTLGFWKNMAKGVFTGAISNAAGLWAYNSFMNGKFGAIDAAKETITGEKLVPVDTQGAGTADKIVPVKTDNIVLVKYKTYKIEVTVDGDKKAIRAIQETPVEPSAIPKDAKRIQDCGESILQNYDGIPNLTPDAAVFQKQNLAEDNVKAVVNYYEKYGRILKQVDTAQYRVPEALVVTVAVWYTGLGAHPIEGKQNADDWIAGCNTLFESTRKPEDNFRCAAIELKKGLDACGQDARCALEKYHAAQSPNDKTRVDYGKLEKVYNIWNSREFSLSSKFN